MSTIDLLYDPETLLPAPNALRFGELERFLEHYWELDELMLPRSFVDHVSRFHGGVPTKSCFQTVTGQVRSIGRFANLLKDEDIQMPRVPTWRSDENSDIRLDYSVFHYIDYEKWDGRLREVDALLLPIAGLDVHGQNCRGMNEYDLLCIVFGQDGREQGTVVFSYEAASLQDRVSATFAELLASLYECHLSDEGDIDSF